MSKFSVKYRLLICTIITTLIFTIGGIGSAQQDTTITFLTPPWYYRRDSIGTD